MIAVDQCGSPAQHQVKRAGDPLLTSSAKIHIPPCCIALVPILDASTNRISPSIPPEYDIQ